MAASDGSGLRAQAQMQGEGQAQAQMQGEGQAQVETLDFAHQNYDAVFKDAVSIFKDKAVDFFGIGGGVRIEESWRTEKREVRVRATFSDLTFRLSNGQGLHLEQEAVLSHDDLLRFCGYHVDLMRDYGCDFVTAILVKEPAGVTAVDTAALRFCPVIVDCSKKDGDAILAGLKKNVELGLPVNELEIIFLPLFRSVRLDPAGLFAEALAVAKKLGGDPARIEKVAALLIVVSNKLVDKDSLKSAWGEIKMLGLKVLEVAVEKGFEQGVEKGMEKGIEQGVKKGIKKGVKTVALNMLRRGKAVQEVCEDTGLTKKQVQELQKALSTAK